MNPDAATRLEGQVLALAAVVEAAQLVEQLARHGNAPAAEMEALVDGVFRFEWQAASEVFGDAERLARGLKLLSVLLRDPAMPGHRALLWQVLALLHLGRRLSRDPQMLTRLRARLEHAAVKSAHFSSAFDELATSLAAIYQDTISTYPLRIRVNGNAQHLQDARVAARIRALLLAGLRAAVLWRHLGGSRGALLLQRRQLLGACHRLQQPPA